MTESVRLVPTSMLAFQGRRAGVVTRVAAAVIDGMVVVIAVLAGYMFAVGVLFIWNPRRFQMPVPPYGLLVLVTGAVLAAYLTVCWERTGRTYGGRVLGVRVIDGRGHAPSAARAVARALCCVVVPFGLLWAAVDRHNRSVQDLLLGTSVIYDWDVSGAELDRHSSASHSTNPDQPKRIARS